jgi:hypothetical protein
MILFADGRAFTIAGEVLSDGTTIIPFSAITIGAKETAFPLPLAGVIPPVMFVTLDIIGEGSHLTALSILDYNKLAIAQSTRNIAAAQTPLTFLQRTATTIARRCGSCGGGRT